MVTASEIKHSNAVYSQLESLVMDNIFLTKDGTKYDYTKKNKKKLIDKFRAAGFQDPETLARLFISQSQGTTDKDGNKVESANNENIIQIAQTFATTLAADPTKINSFIESGILPENEAQWASLTQNLNQILTLRETGFQLQEELMGLTRGDLEYDRDYQGIFWDMGMGQAPPGYQEGSASEGMAGTKTGDRVDIGGTQTVKPPSSIFTDYDEGHGDYTLNNMRYLLTQEVGNDPSHGKNLMKLVTEYNQYLEDDYTFMPISHGMDDLGDDRRAIADQSKDNVATLWGQIEDEMAIIERLEGKLSSGRGTGAGVVGKLPGLTNADKMDIHRQIVAHTGKLALLQRDYKQHQNFSNMAVQESYGYTDEQGNFVPAEDKTWGDFMKGDYAFNFLGFNNAEKQLKNGKNLLWQKV